MRKCSMSKVIREMHWERTIRYHFPPTGSAKIKRLVFQVLG